MSDKIKIYGELESGASGSFVTEAAQIRNFDEKVLSLVQGRLVALTQEEYNALPVKDPDTYYFIYEGEGPTPPTPTGDESIDTSTHALVGSLVQNNTIISDGVIIDNVLNI